MDIAKIVGERVKKLRMEKLLTQKEFAKSLGTTQEQVSFWETGRCLVPILKLLVIVEVYEVSLSYFDIYSEENCEIWY